jgi:hypothetical protein
VVRAARLLALLLGLLLCGAAPAAEAPKGPPPIDDFTAAVPDMPGTTWLDLLRPLFPGIAEATTMSAAATATGMIDLRSIGAGDDSWAQCGDKIELRSLDARPIQLGDKRRLVVTVSFADDCTGLLALFDAAGKLIDAVNVKGDQHVSFGDDYVRPLGAAGALVIASNWHDNSNQSYDIATLVLAKPDGFTSIGDVLAFGSRSCRDRFTEETVIRTAPAAPMARIDALVKRREQKFAADCDTKRGPETVRVFTGNWRWNAAKSAYEAHTAQLDALAKSNAKDF